jgi:hypothetical protein
MQRNLIVWLSEGDRLCFNDVTRSWVTGNIMFFNTAASGLCHCGGINMTEVIAWEFVSVPKEKA